MRLVWLWLLLFFSFPTHAHAQQDLPRGYFRNPLEIPMDLSGNFGELRANHFHMGLDLKTQRRQNLPVHAAADGYVARVKVEPFGFGRSIYINHPNGFTTVYAHLNAFYPELEAWVTRQQYDRRSWSVYLEIPPGLFPVKKGQFIARSGTTGGSQAPHLHFEIRRTADDVNLNPMLFGFPLADNTRPRLLRVAFYDRKRSLYEQSPKIVALKPAGTGAYVAQPSPVTVSSPLISLAFTGYDTHTGSSNINGIFSARLFVDQVADIGFTMDSISYNDTRYLNAHIDYKTKAGGGPYLQLLSELPGYINAIYSPSPSNGVIDISDGKIHQWRIEVKDAYGNTSEARGSIRYVAGGPDKPVSSGKMFYPLMLDGYESPDCEFFIGEKCLYDSVHILHQMRPAGSPAAVSDIHRIGNSGIPLQEAFLVRIRPSRELSENEKKHTVMQWFQGNRDAVAPVSWQDNWASARFRDFGDFQLVLDQTPPEIIPSGFTDNSNLSKASRLVFYVKDNLGSLAEVTTTLDGDWIRFSNDKAKAFIYEFDEHCKPGRHTLSIRATDLAGNTTEKSFSFTR